MDDLHSRPQVSSANHPYDASQLDKPDGTDRHNSAKAAAEGPSPSGLGDWWPILREHGLSYREMALLEKRAHMAGVSFQTELLVSGVVDETALFRSLARYLKLDFVDALDPARLFMRTHQGVEALRRPAGLHTVQAMDDTGQTVMLIAPGGLDIVRMQNFVARYPEQARSLRLVPPSTLRQAVQKRSQKGLLRLANSGLFEAAPRFSARNVVNAWQGAALGSLAVSFLMSVVLWPSTSLIILHCVLSLAFLACVMVRVSASGFVCRTPPAPSILQDVQTEEMPVYTVLVALYKEADVVPDLLMALGRLVWPRSKLEIKLVCESDDHETLAAIRARKLRSYIEVIQVPPGGPRTKPKALSYALPLSTGEFVVLFDAEDSPHPFQLVEAYQRFRQGGEKLACLQAPLVISNRHESWLSAMFAFEYSALFHGILPWLAHRGLMMPLGGTSNHFRRTILEKIGGWDPCNVTEDADLGVRLARQGYRTGTIGHPTYEDAPTTARVWLPQRTRWFKGWAQTWLVHMRNVRDLYRDLGPASFMVTQVLVAGMLISALAYPVFMLTILGLTSTFFMDGSLSAAKMTLLTIDVVNIVLGHAAFLALGWWSMPKTRRQGLLRHVLLTPCYWMLMSGAAWRALWSLYRRPHHWEKTPHRPSGMKNVITKRRRMPRTRRGGAGFAMGGAGSRRAA